MGLSWWRSWESTEHRSGRCWVFELCLKVVSMFRKYSIQCLSSSMSYSWGTVFSGVISKISKYSMFPMLLIISFDCSQNGLNARFCFRSACYASLFGCVSNWWINFWDCFLADVIVLLDSRMRQSLDPEVYITATTFGVRSTVTILVVLASMVGGCSRVRVLYCPGVHNASSASVQFSLRCSERLIRFAVQLFSWLPDHHLLDAHRR